MLVKVIYWSNTVSVFLLSHLAHKYNNRFKIPNKNVIFCKKRWIMDNQLWVYLSLADSQFETWNHKYPIILEISQIDSSLYCVSLRMTTTYVIFHYHIYILSLALSHFLRSFILHLLAFDMKISYIYRDSCSFNLLDVIYYEPGRYILWQLKLTTNS